jgi:predicted TIM-barrel enzyme
MDVVTTSGIATGHEAEGGKIADFRAGLENAPLALASGITPENAARYGRDVDCFLVATGINRDGDFYNIDPARLDALLAVTRNIGAKP